MLRPLATLFSLFAEIHAFADANSRTRTLVLDSELTRLGGHPLVFYTNGWAVYRMPSMEYVELYILRSWCAWHFAVRDGQSPYLAVGTEHDDVKAEAIARTLSFKLYDPDTDACVDPSTARATSVQAKFIAEDYYMHPAGSSDDASDAGSSEAGSGFTG